MKKFLLLPAQVYLFFILILAAGLMIWAAATDSAITDEQAHIPAGYAYVSRLDFRLNPEHPPLLKALSAVPLLFFHLNFPDNSDAWLNEINSQWTIGTQFFYESGNNANTIIFVSRIFPIILTLLTIFFLYFWSRKVLGAYWALVPALLFGLSPTVLAHGHYVTTDIGATFGILTAIYFFVQFLFHSSRKNFFLAGLFFGIAQLLKFSAVLLAPFFALLVFCYVISRTLQRRIDGTHRPVFRFLVVELLKTSLATFGIALFGILLVVTPVYSLFTLHYPIEKQFSDTSFLLSSFSGGPTPIGTSCHIIRCVADITIALSHHPFTRGLAQYMLGVLMVVQRATGGNTNYFLGSVAADGSFWYFPIVYLLKESIPTLVIILIALILTALSAFSFFLKEKRFSRFLHLIANLHFTGFSIFSAGFFVLFYWVYSMRSPLNIGFRHILPTVPFIYLVSVFIWKKWIAQSLSTQVYSSSFFSALFHRLKTLAAAYLKIAIISVLCLWFILESLVSAPYFLSYFNELGGGAWGGYRFVTDSNYDWGQDMLRLVEWTKANPQVQSFAIDYFGAGNPHYYFQEKAHSWSSAQGNPALAGIDYLVISINTLQGAMQPAKFNFNRAPQDEYRWLIESRRFIPHFLGDVPPPDYRIGTTLFVYKLK